VWELLLMNIFHVQDEVVKLTDKCLNNAIESPIAAATWLPADMKSNILKAQAEAQGHKVNTQLMRTTVFSDGFLELLVRRPRIQEVSFFPV